MSSQKFSASQREALWLAHNKKCAYTRELLDISSFHIDHIIPESVADNPIQLQQVKAILRLDEDFNLYGYENLLPCCASANLQKGVCIFDEARINYFLGIAKSKRAEVQRNLEKIKKRESRGKALILLQQCLECGDLSVSEVAKILEDHNEQPHEIFRLIEVMKFADATEVQTVAKADIEELRNKPIRLGQNDHIDGITLTNDASKQVYVTTCKEYDTAIKYGYYDFANFDIKMSTFFEHQCGLLSSLQAAVTPERSLIADPRVGIFDLYLIPFSFFPSFGDVPKEDHSVATYQSKVDDGTIVIKRLRQNTLCVERSESIGQQLIEIVRADFNHDGIEDILLFEYCYATHGTFGFGNI
jgi:hypothetical protein